MMSMPTPTTISDIAQSISDLEGQGAAMFDGANVALSSGYTHDNRVGFDLFATARQIGQHDDERALYKTYWTEFMENDLAQFLVLNLVSNLMDFRFESEDAGDLALVEDFFYNNDTREELNQVLINAFVHGTGICQRHLIGTQLDFLSRIDASTIMIEKNGRKKGRLQFKFSQVQVAHDDSMLPIKKTVTLRSTKIATFKPIEVPQSAYGKSMMRSSLLPLQAMRQLNMDIPAGLKRLAYETMVLYLNMEGVPETKQKTMMGKALKSFAKYDSATNSVIALDERHSLKYVGTDGGSSQKIVPVLDIVEPILIFLLNKWYVPLGDVLQEKSNRALAQTQTSTARKRLDILKQRFARFIEKEVISYITGEVGVRPSVRVVHNVPFVEQKDEIETMVLLFKNNLITRETVQARLPFEVKGETYFNNLDVEKTQVVTDIASDAQVKVAKAMPQPEVPEEDDEEEVPQ